MMLPTALIGLLFVGSIMMHGMAKQAFLACYILLLVIVSLTRFHVGAAVVFSATSLIGIVRWNDAGNPLAAGFDTLLILSLTYVAAIRQCMCRARQCVSEPTHYRSTNREGDQREPDRMREGRRLLRRHMAHIAGNARGGCLLTKSQLAIVCTTLLLSYVMFHILSYMEKPLLVLVMVREYIVPFLFVLVMYYAYKTNRASAYVAFTCVFWTTVAVACLNLYHYAVGTDIAVSRWVLHPGTEMPAIRMVFGFPITRMNHIFRLSTQGAGGTYYTLFAITGVLLARHQRRARSRALYLFGVFVLIACALLTVSLSILPTAMIALFFMLMWRDDRFHRKQHRIVRLYIFAVVMFLILLVRVGTSSGEELSVVQYGFDSFVLPMLDSVQEWTVLDWIVGPGLGVKSGANLGARELLQISQAALVDRWIFVSLLQMGLVGFFLVGCVWLSAISLAIPESVRTCRQRHWAAVLCGVIIAGSLGFSHGAAILERLFSPLFLGCMGFLLAMYHRSTAGSIIVDDSHSLDVRLSAS